MHMAALIGNCPSCGGKLRVQRLWCDKCEIAVEGNLTMGTLARLQPEEQRFIVEFVKASGSLKEIARQYGVSYPTVRNRLNDLIARLEELEKTGEEDE
jgi:hypothetical protein